MNRKLPPISIDYTPDELQQLEDEKDGAAPEPEPEPFGMAEFLMIAAIVAVLVAVIVWW